MGSRLIELTKNAVESLYFLNSRTRANGVLTGANAVIS